MTQNHWNGVVRYSCRTKSAARALRRQETEKQLNSVQPRLRELKSSIISGCCRDFGDSCSVQRLHKDLSTTITSTTNLTTTASRLPSDRFLKSHVKPPLTQGSGTPVPPSHNTFIELWKRVYRHSSCVESARTLVPAPEERLAWRALKMLTP